MVTRDGFEWNILDAVQAVGAVIVLLIVAWSIWAAEKIGDGMHTAISRLQRQSV